MDQQELEKSPYWGTNPQDPPYWIIPAYHIAERKLVDVMANLAIFLREQTYLI